uniref:GST N-terminal domain-containing protein n=1 Tax=Globisporangium ultimum (strain ATCC 200006 / CBS 805.95 / DAOM BR144) TaxID=431595 RepID=K3XBB3_GLOUD
MSATHLKLSYFDLSGLGECLKLKCPFGQLLVLQADGTLYAQSTAIVRYPARVDGLYPRDPADALRVEMISETLLELVMAYLDARYSEPNELLKAEKYKKLVAENGAKDKATYVDVQLLDVVLNALNAIPAPAFNLALFPKLKAIVATIKESEHIATYLRSKSPF